MENLMAWNEPGGKDKDPWGGGNRGNKNDGPPDLDELAKKVQDKLNGLFGGSGGGGSGGVGKLLLPIAVIALLYLATQGVYRIDQQERGVVLRLGEYHRTLLPGLNWATPLLESVTKVNVTRLRQHSASAEMLTKDENIVSVSLSVQFNIADAESYALRVRDPEQSLKEATDSALRHVVGSSKMDEVLTVGREKIAQDVQLRLQEYLDD
jgi:membrane protease subunit HflK